MQTQVRSPEDVFVHSQRLVVPLFQRPYVWNQDDQWEPLWHDVVHLADGLLGGAPESPEPHFLGAVVLQQTPNTSGSVQLRTVIDGQQRLTTIQLLLDAVRLSLTDCGSLLEASRIEDLVSNAEKYCRVPEDRFKIWPTNRDQTAFAAVMGGATSDDVASSKLHQAHEYFREQARAWLAGGEESTAANRGEALERASTKLLQMVVIDLDLDENAQEIFETLNARGTPLTPADLIKNFVFQRLQAEGADVQGIYRRHWQEFETAFWEKEVGSGRVTQQRSSLFLNHWLAAQTRLVIPARQVFAQFKRYVDRSATVPVHDLVTRIHEASTGYRAFTEVAADGYASLDRLGLFAYRTSVMESDVVRPLVLWLYDPHSTPIPQEQLERALGVIESWMVRRMLLRLTSKSFNRIIADILNELQQQDRQLAGDVLEHYLARQEGQSRYWPDDHELRTGLASLSAYRQLARGRLRMTLEAIEDHLRGFRDGRSGLGAERVARHRLTIEHVMPQSWLANWPLPLEGSEHERASLIDTIGNLTLLTAPLNTKVSNGPWDGTDSKKSGLHKHDVLLLNRDLLDNVTGEWDESNIQTRTERLANYIVEIWPVPAGPRSRGEEPSVRAQRTAALVDLISAGLLVPGQRLFPRPVEHREIEVSLLSDGRIDVAGTIYDTPTGASKAIAGHRNGWLFFLTDLEMSTDLSSVWSEYLSQIESDGPLDVELLGLEQAP
jgi:hypothetical protein